MTDLLGDPHEGAPLRVEGELLRNDAGVWPILGGIPVLVPDPARWLASRREAVLAALAEAGRADPGTVERLDAFVSQVRGAGRIEVPDDFLDREEPPYELVPGPVADALRALVDGPSLAERLAPDCAAGPVLEIGCGSGALTRRIAGRPLFVVDHSLRALLRATAGTDARPVLGDALSLPFPDEALETVVAANVIDLVDDPASLIDEVARVLRPGGRFVCATPDPALGICGPDEALVDLIEAADLRVVSDRDGQPWIRVHGPRHVQVYAVREIVAVR